MMKRTFSSALILMSSFLLFACAGEKLELEVKALLDGKPAAEAKVLADGKEIGVTNAEGLFLKVIRKKAGADVEISVLKEAAGFRIEPWKTTFLMKLPKNGAVEKYSFTADLQATRYVTVAVTEKGTPIEGAVVKASGKEVGTTDAKGEFIYDYKELPKQGIDLAVTKSGYSLWRKTGAVEPGERLAAELSKRAMVTVTTLKEEYGETSPVQGIRVSINNKEIGKTNNRGVVVYNYDGEPGKKASLSLSAPGYIPSTWKATVILEGEQNIQRYFYPTTPRAIRVGIYRFASNTPGVDLKDVLARTEAAVGNNLFKYRAFREVSSAALQADMKKYRISIDKAVTRGWSDTGLRRTVDMIVVGSVAKDQKGLLIETKFYTSGGKLILSQIMTARDERDIGNVAKEIASAVVERFPFEGTIIDVDGDRYRINLGKADYRIGKGMEFALMSPSLTESGKVSGYRDIGRVKVRKTDDAASMTEVEDLKKGEKVSVGDRVVRRIYRDEEGLQNYFVLSAKGGVPPDVSPLVGVNIYLNDDWVGSTGAGGKAEIPIRVGKSYNLMLYRHGYQQLSEKVKIEKNKDTKEFVLQVNNSLFKLETEPSGADVFIDDEKVGRTPIHDGKLVSLGFHTVRITVGGDYRDWEEVVEFDKKVEDRTGGRKIILQKDYLKMGERAEQKNDYDAAIQAYRSTEKGHPDYSEAHHRLAQIYLDQKNDYDAAIREFENVLSLPENEQLIYKQFAVAFTNLGHAYYEKGNALVQRDKENAAQSFAKAIQNLKTAKQNTRFFPNLQYDEAVHDTYYYTALAYHKLYLLTRKSQILNDANLAWREYFDFFPKKLEGNSTYEQSREAAQKYWNQIKDMM